MRPILREYERAEKFPAEQLKKLGELGCCGMLVPEEWGGAGTDTVSYALMLEEVARVDASTAVALSVTNSVVAIPLWKSGSEAQKKKYLTRLSRGEILGAFCLTEPQAGSDAAGIQSRAVREGDHYILNGTKAWVTNGGVSGVYIVFAKTDPAAGSRGVTAFLVEPDFPGFRISRYEDKMGLQPFALRRNFAAGLPRARGKSPRRRRPGPAHRARIARRRPRRYRRAIRRRRPRRAGSRRRVTPSNAKLSASPSPNTKPSNGCWPTWKQKSKPPARSLITPHGSATKNSARSRADRRASSARKPPRQALRQRNGQSRSLQSRPRSTAAPAIRAKPTSSATIATPAS